jgi:hypothetical protein
MEEIEVWTDISNFDGLYQISVFGNVKSFHGKEKIIKKIIRSEYYYVNLWKNGKQCRIDVHQLMAITYLNHIPCGMKLVINHIDGNKLNNYLSNIEIVTNRANTSTCFRKNKNSFTSKYVGVYWHKTYKKWISRIRTNGNHKYLGSFDLEIEASNAYQYELSKL